MTPMHAAARAESRESWKQVLRITEAAEASPASTGPRAEVSAANFMQAIADGLQTAWKWVERKRSLQLASKRLRVAETISLGEKRTISIVMVDGAQYLIGSSGGGVQLLTRLDETSEPPIANERHL